MRLALCYCHRDNAWGYLRAVKHLGGVTMQARHGEARLIDREAFDAVLMTVDVASQFSADKGESLGIPIVICEHVDGSQLQNRAMAEWSAVRAILKRSTLTPASLHNTTGGRYHAMLLHQQGVRGKHSVYERGKPPQLSSDALSKIRPLVGFAAHDQTRALADHEPDYLASRIYDVHFAGTVSYGDTEVHAHRHAAYAAAHGWTGKRIAIAGRRMKLGEYRRTLQESRASLCPWGWGETCYRDFETMFAGAVCIKPSMGHVATWPNLFDPGVTYVPCKLDFSDAREIIADIRDNWPKYEPMRREARRRALIAARTDSIAWQLSSIISEVIQ